MRRLISLAALAVAIGAVACSPAAADTGPISYAQAPEWISPQSTGHYSTDPSSPGPSVVVDVPNSGGGMGWIEVWAQVKANQDGTAIGLFDITGSVRRFVPGQDTLCASTTNPPLRGDLFLTFDGIGGTYSTPMTAGFGGCSPTTGAPGPVLLHVTAGKRRFRLEYANCGCGPTPMVSHRKLWIRPAS